MRFKSPVLTLPEAAKYLRVGESSLRKNWARAGGVKVVGRIRFHKDVLDYILMGGELEKVEGKINDWAQRFEEIQRRSGLERTLKKPGKSAADRWNI